MSGFRTDPSFLLQLASHEAAHAVVAIAEAKQLGFEDVVLGLTLDKAGQGSVKNICGKTFSDTRGTCQLSTGWMASLRIRSTDKPELRRATLVAEAHMRILLAGPYAELEFISDPDSFAWDGHPSLRGCDGDFHSVRSLRNNLPMLGTRRQSWAKIHSKAKGSVRDYWVSIQRIAGALVDAGELNGQQVYALAA